MTKQTVLAGLQTPIYNRRTDDTGERLTPAWILNLALQTMHMIDLDPCAEIPTKGQRHNVPARAHWTIEDDCLTKQWFGRVFLNPPWGEDNGQREIHAKLVREYDTGRVHQSLVVTRVDPSTRWWKVFAPRFEWCGLWDRPKFDNMTTGSNVPVAVWWIGEDATRFESVWSQVGQIYRPVNARRLF